MCDDNDFYAKFLQFNTVQAKRCKAAREFLSLCALASWNKEIISTFSFARLCSAVDIALNASHSSMSVFVWFRAFHFIFPSFLPLSFYMLCVAWNSSEMNVEKRNTVRKVDWTSEGKKRSQIMFYILWGAKNQQQTNKHKNMHSALDIAYDTNGIRLDRFLF